MKTEIAKKDVRQPAAPRRRVGRPAIGRWAWFYDRRRALDLSQTDLADRVGCWQGQITRWERGLAVPNARYYPKLASALDVTIAELATAIGQKILSDGNA